MERRGIALAFTKRVQMALTFAKSMTMECAVVTKTIATYIISNVIRFNNAIGAVFGNEIVFRFSSCTYCVICCSNDSL